jgi:hypothetical protein
MIEKRSDVRQAKPTGGSERMRCRTESSARCSMWRTASADFPSVAPDVGGGAVVAIALEQHVRLRPRQDRNRAVNVVAIAPLGVESAGLAL